MQSKTDMAKSLHNHGFWLGCLALLAMGSLMRLLPPLGVTSSTVSKGVSTAYTEGLEWVVSDEAAENAVAFYRDMQDEYFAEGCERSVELGWEWSDAGEIHASTILMPKECEQISRAELTAPGGGFVLYDIEVDSILPPPDAAQPLELALMQELGTRPNVLSLSWLKARGTTQLQCTVFDWERDLVALKIGSDWRVLLPPPAQYSKRRMLGWFYAWDSAPRVERP